MKQMLVGLTVFLMNSCNVSNKVNPREKAEEKVGTIVLVKAKTKPEYSQNEVVRLSRAIDPMVDEFEGYLGRKMAFSAEEDNQDLVDLVYYTDENAFAEATEKEMKSEICAKFFVTMDESKTMMLTFFPEIISDSKTGEAKTMELVLFKPKSEITRTNLIEARRAIHPILEKYDGYISSKFASTRDGQWLDIVYWTDLEKAKAAAKTILENQICQKYFAMIDEPTMQFMHLNIVIDTEQIK